MFHCQILVSRSTDGKPLNLSEFCASPLPKEVCSLVVAIIQCALKESSYDYSVSRLFLLVFHQRKTSFTTSPPLHLTREAHGSRTLLFIPCFVPRSFLFLFEMPKNDFSKGPPHDSRICRFGCFSVNSLTLWRTRLKSNKPEQENLEKHLSLRDEISNFYVFMSAAIWVFPKIGVPQMDDL